MRRDLIAIDFGNAFTGANWNAEHLALNHDGNAGHVGEWLFRGLGDHESGRRAAVHLARLALSGGLGGAIDEVAPSWDLDTNDRKAVEHFLEARARVWSSGSRPTLRRPGRRSER